MRLSKSWSEIVSGVSVINRPVAAGSQPASGPRFADQRVHALLHALILFQQLAQGFRAVDLRQHLDAPPKLVDSGQEGTFCAATGETLGRAPGRAQGTLGAPRRRKRPTAKATEQRGRQRAYWVGDSIMMSRGYV